MNMEPPSSEYLLLFRGTDWGKHLSPEEMQTVMTRWMAWFDGLMQEGLAKAGQPLADTGKLVSGKNGNSVVDGPFAESKEAIGGYFLLQVNNAEQAVKIARQCPGLDYGLTVEVRPVSESCSISQSVAAHAATATP